MDRPSSKTAPAPATIEERIEASFRRVEQRAAQSSPIAGAIAQMRAGAHRLRSALTPVSNNLQFVLEEEPLSDEGRAAVGDAQEALGRALEALDAMVAAVEADQPCFLLAEALGAAAPPGVPALRLQGLPEYLSAAVESLLAEAGPAARLRVHREGRQGAAVEIEGGAPFDRAGVAVGLASRLLRRLGGELDLVERTARLHLPGAPAEAPVPADDPRAPRLLLIVDDEPELAPMFRRFLRHDFDEVLEAGGAEQAEALLRAHPVTHLVVDAALQDTCSGAERVAHWREAAPSVRWAALFSGSTTLRGAAPGGVDAVYVKPDGFDALVQALRRPKER